MPGQTSDPIFYFKLARFNWIFDGASLHSDMPSNYLFRMATMTFREEEEDKMIPYSESEMQFISKEDMKRLKAARSSYK